MDDRVKRLIGSPFRDAFKHWHKHKLPKEAWMMDIDGAFVGKPDILFAIIDAKQRGDKVSFTEVNGYNWFIEQGVPVFIVTPHSDTFECFDVDEYLTGDYAFPPNITSRPVLRNATADEYVQWEMSLRK